LIVTLQAMDELHRQIGVAFIGEQWPGEPVETTCR
jgi:hypothetical protein